MRGMNLTHSAPPVWVPFGTRQGQVVQGKIVIFLIKIILKKKLFLFSKLIRVKKFLLKMKSKKKIAPANFLKPDKRL